MKLVVPINNYQEIDRLIEEGADDFYFGYLDKEWLLKYSCFSGNRRENFHANFTEINDVYNATQKIHSAGMKIAVTMNDRYTESQYDSLKPVVDKIVDAGVDAFIIADLGLLLKFKEWNIKAGIHISTGGGVFNQQTALFFQDFNVERIILPRQLSLSEIKCIAECSNTSFEIFGIFGRDPYIDAFCRFHHGINCIFPKIGPCGCIRLNEADFRCVGTCQEQNDERQIFKPFRSLNHIQVDGCAACILPFLNIQNVNYLKIVGRGANTDRKVQGIRMLKHGLQLANKEMDISEVVTSCKAKFNEVFSEYCVQSNCYYENIVEFLKSSG